MPDNSTLLPTPATTEDPLPFTSADPSPNQIDPDFDEAAYLRSFPDVAAAVQRGMLASGLSHYMFLGKAERRLELPQYRQSIGARSALVTEVAPVTSEIVVAVKSANGPSVSVDALLISASGAVFLVGWTDDCHNPLVAITLRSGQDARPSWTRFPRVRRRDVEASLNFSGSYQHGFWAFAGADDTSGPRPTLRGAESALELCYANGAIVELSRVPDVVSDTEMRDTVMRHFATCEYWGNRSIEAFTGLDEGVGDAFIEFNRSISRGFGSQPLVERFGQTQRRPKASIIVPIYGIADYLFLQSCAYAQGRNIADYEFIYVVNSPELIEQLCREARIAQMVYGLAQTLVALPGNAGFGGANNIAAQFARSDRLLCLNPDVFPRDPDWTRRHLDILANLPEAQTRLFGSSLYYDDGSLMHGGMYFEVDPSFHFGAGGTTRRGVVRVEHYGKGAPPWATQYVASRPVPAVTGAFMSIDRAWFEKLGGFTEDYVFGHYEDADLCLKSLLAGTPAWLHDIGMWHLEGKGSRRLPQHEGGSLLNRWHFSRTWLPKIVPDVVGRTPQHRLLQIEAQAQVPSARPPGMKPFGMEPPDTKSPDTKPVATKSLGTKSLGTKSPGMKSPGTKSSGTPSFGTKSEVSPPRAAAAKNRTR